MRRTKHRDALVVIGLGLAACITVPRRVEAQSSILVETLPASDSTQRRSPFYSAAPDMQSANRLVGCYVLTLGPWSTPQADSARIPIPSRLDLLSEAHRRIYIGFRLVAQTPGSSPQTDKFPPAWSPIGDDSLQVRVWANGSSSVALFLRRQPDKALRGTARYFIDGRTVDRTGRWMWETYPIATASLHPTEC